jgi:hypothetical protein
MYTYTKQLEETTVEIVVAAAYLTILFSFKVFFFFIKE